MDPAVLRFWWWRRQGLDCSMRGASAAEVLERSGWARSVGGAAPYLTLFSRARISRHAADEAAAAVQIHELPAARGCTYVVPASDFELALAAGANDADMRTARKLGVSDAEIARLCEAVVKALEEGPLDPEAIKERVGPAVRSLGPEGAKKGLTTTLPVALGRLQSSGAIRRVATNGRFDSQRYRYTLWGIRPSVLSAAELAVQLAERYFRWAGPASLPEFQQFSSLGVKAAKAAVSELGLVPVGERFAFPEDERALRELQIPKEPQYELVSSLDAIVLLRRDAQGVTGAGGFSDLPHNAILDRGQIVGLWEFDPTAQAIVWKVDIRSNDALKSAVGETEQFAREQLGDVRSYSLDSPKSRAVRIESLRVGA